MANHTALIARDGREIPIEDSAAPIRDKSGTIMGVVLVFHDVTEQRKAQDGLRRSHEELEKRVRERTAELQVSNKALIRYAAKLERLNEELQDFAFVASHDLQEPLRKIQIFSGMVAIDDMPGIEADEDQIFRLFQNLIGNALKFHGEASPRISIYAKRDGGDRCDIFVEDNGIGFGQQFAERIFKPFERLHSRREYEGTGMGLALCRKIVEWHGGASGQRADPGKDRLSSSDSL
ncbi:ATPase/histidine kinase/DNA gyrase B/HSP90 domain protein [delta proteobacterium NaphS2]|nr:ATPase/histidine kinase/DNA gyrase B/HSP90 domain protein [delta proteobacterium NaphS2]